MYSLDRYGFVFYISNLDLKKHLRIFTRASTDKSTQVFFVALQLNNPRLLGGVHYCTFFVGVSPVAYTEVRTIRASGE